MPIYTIYERSSRLILSHHTPRDLRRARAAHEAWHKCAAKNGSVRLWPRPRRFGKNCSGVPSGALFFLAREQYPSDGEKVHLQDLQGELEGNERGHLSFTRQVGMGKEGQ